MAKTGAWNFEVTLVDEVPLTRNTMALPMPWQAMVDKFEKDGKGEKAAAITVPKDFWIKDRKVPDDDKAAGIAAGRLKASFSGFRQGVEKHRGGLVGWGLTVVEMTDDDGNWTGHRLFIEEQDLEARKEARARAQNAAEKRKADAAKAAKKGTTGTKKRAA
jgi:hypothetical protein